jgi:hypothetical protein
MVIFHEREVDDRLTAASVMLAGALSFSSHKHNLRAINFSAAVPLGSIVAHTMTCTWVNIESI